MQLSAPFASMRVYQECRDRGMSPPETVETMVSALGLKPWEAREAVAVFCGLIQGHPTTKQLSHLSLWLTAAEVAALAEKGVGVDADVADRWRDTYGEDPPDRKEWP